MDREERRNDSPSWLAWRREQIIRTIRHERSISLNDFDALLLFIKPKRVSFNTGQPLNCELPSQVGGQWNEIN